VLFPGKRAFIRTTQQFSITLPHDMAEAVESKIKSGAYAFVSDGVRALLERDAAVERCLREEVMPGHQEYLRDVEKGGSGLSGSRPSLSVLYFPFRQTTTKNTIPISI
jgi:antitoxin ParD1/3/4